MCTSHSNGLLMLWDMICMCVPLCGGHGSGWLVLWHALSCRSTRFVWECIHSVWESSEWVFNQFTHPITQYTWTPIHIHTYTCTHTHTHTHTHAHMHTHICSSVCLCSMQIQREKAWEIWSHAATSGRQRVDKQGAVPDINNSHFMLDQPWHHEQQY